MSVVPPLIVVYKTCLLYLLTSVVQNCKQRFISGRFEMKQSMRTLHTMRTYRPINSCFSEMRDAITRQNARVPCDSRRWNRKWKIDPGGWMGDGDKVCGEDVVRPAGRADRPDSLQLTSCLFPSSSANGSVIAKRCTGPALQRRQFTYSQTTETSDTIASSTHGKL